MNDLSDSLPDSKLDALLQLEQHLQSGTPLGETQALSAEELDHAKFLLEQLRMLQTPLYDPAESTTRDQSLPSKIGKYRIDKQLGCGGFAIVYQGWDSDLNRYAAIKVPLPRNLMNDDLQNRFLKESQTTAQLVHPHIVPIYDANGSGCVPYIALAYCDGPTLAEYLKGHGPLPFEIATKIISQIADAVEYSHQHNVLHRDIKPANVLLFKSDTSNIPNFPYDPRLSDFGLAKILEDAALQSQSSMMLGTAMYLAPELITSPNPKPSEAADVFGLGAVLYEMVSGRPPYVGDSLYNLLASVREGTIPSLHDLVQDVPIDLASICHQAISKAPQDRYASAGELRDDLIRFIKNEPVKARPQPCCRRLLRWMQEPARVKEAATLTMAINIVLMLWVTIFPIAILFGLRMAKNISLEEVMPSSMPIIILHGALSFLALQLSKGKLWAAIATTFVNGSIFLFQMSILMSLTPPPFSTIYDNERARDIVFNLLCCLSLLQTILSSFAWVSIKSRRT